MKIKLWSLFALLFMCFGNVTQVHAQERGEHPRTISVVGTAEVTVAPDEAVLTLGVDSRDMKLEIAKLQNDRVVKKMLEVASESGVDSKYIHTSELSMGPIYTEDKIPKLIGYEVSQTIVVTLKDLSTYEALMTNFLQAGANRVNGIEFTLSDAQKYRADARANALRAAREKAVAMAAVLGQTVGKPSEISEGSEPDVQSLQTNSFMAYDRGFAKQVESTLPSGQVSVRASVRVRFDLE